MVAAGAAAALKKNYIIDDPYARDMLMLDVRAALEAIAPMAEKLLREQAVKHVDAGYDLALKRAHELFRDADDYWWIGGQLEKLEIPR